MDDLISILRQGNANVRLEVSGADLLAFSNELINRAKSELSAEIADARKEKYLTKEEINDIRRLLEGGRNTKGGRSEK